MTSVEFSQLALSFPETEAINDRGFAEYRSGGRVFASIPDADGGKGVVWLEPREVARLAQKHRGFAAEGLHPKEGPMALTIDLAEADVHTVNMAAAAAWGLATSRLV